MLEHKLTPGISLINRQIKDSKTIRYKKSDAVKMLEDMATKAAISSHPNTPPHYIARRKYKDNSANGLTKCVIDFLRLKGHQAEGISNTGRMIDNRITFCDVIGCQRTIGRTEWIKGTGTNRTADISAIIAGQSVKIEVKFGKDIQSEAQWQYQQTVIHPGGIYFIATSFEQFYNWYHKTFCHE